MNTILHLVLGDATLTLTDMFPGGTENPRLRRYNVELSVKQGVLMCQSFHRFQEAYDKYQEVVDCWLGI